MLIESHDFDNDIERADLLLEELFQSSNNLNLLENTAVIVLGDHGPRFGKIRQSGFVGYVEERMPFLSVTLPKNLLKKYPTVKSSIELNKWRLTTPFDVYETLVDILSQNYDGSQRAYNKRGLSLLYEIPLNRSCQEAGIPDMYCLCHKNVLIDTKRIVVKKCAEKLLSHINELLSQTRHLCAFLSIKRIVSSFMVEKEISGYIERQYRVLIETSPGKALLEGTIIKSRTTGILEVVNDISRLNMYGRQAHCMQDTRLQKFCFCKDLLTTGAHLG